MDEQILLDQFATAAMQGLIAANVYKIQESDRIAQVAYSIAQAMMKQSLIQKEKGN